MPDPLIWTDPRFASFFRGAKPLVAQWRMYARHGFEPPQDLVLARLVGVAVRAARQVDEGAQNLGAPSL
jgi:hypothetical protein